MINFNVLTNIVKYFMYINLYPAGKMEVLVENIGADIHAGIMYWKIEKEVVS